MPIKIACQCGQQLTAKDELAGKRVKCPKCGNPLQIPARESAAGGSGQSISDLLDDVGMRADITRCPGCGAEMSDDAILCVMCGFDLRRGHRIKARVGAANEMDDEDLGDLPVHGIAQLDEAEREMARTKLEQERLNTGVPWWMLFIALIGLVGFTVGMYVMPQDQVMQNSGYIMMGAGGLMAFYFAIHYLIHAFKESALQGIMNLVPGYQLYFVASRWDRVGPTFIFMSVGLCILGVGVVMVLYLFPMFEAMIEERKNALNLLTDWAQSNLSRL